MAVSAGRVATTADLHGDDRRQDGDDRRRLPGARNPQQWA
jgi:hypothetical protein